MICMDGSTGELIDRNRRAGRTYRRPRHVARGEIILARQRATIAASERIGHNVARFKEFLPVFEYSQRLHVADRDRLRKDLEDASRPRGEKRPAESRE
jgi:hypothetical protein